MPPAPTDAPAAAGSKRRLAVLIGVLLLLFAGVEAEALLNHDGIDEALGAVGVILSGIAAWWR